MVIEPREKEWGADYLRFGLGLASDFDGENQFNLLVQYRSTWLNRYGAEWLTEAQLGADTHLFTEFYQPLNEAGVWFVAPSAVLGRQTRSVFSNGNKIADYLIDSGGVGLDFGARLRTWGQVRFGAAWSNVDAGVETGSANLPAVRETTAGLRGALFVDQTDHAWFPREGYGLVGTAYAALPSFGSDREYQRLEGSLRFATSWGTHTLNVGLSGGSALGSDMPAYESFTLGGPQRLSAYRLSEFTGREYALGRLMYYKRAVHLPDILGSGVYVGASAEVGRITGGADSAASPGTLWSGSGFLGADTFIGPLYLGLGVGKDNRWSLFLLLGAP
jgi:NTE family protein